MSEVGGLDAINQELDSLKEMVLGLIEVNNQLQMQNTANQHVLTAVLQTVADKAELIYQIEKCSSAYLAYANDIEQDEQVTAIYQEAIDEYLDFLGDVE